MRESLENVQLALSSRLTEQAATATERYNAQDGRSDKLSARIDGNQEQLKTLDAASAQTERGAQETATRLTEVQGAFETKLSQRASAIDARVTELGDALKENTRQLSSTARDTYDPSKLES